jgi:hypothetical protein
MSSLASSLVGKIFDPSRVSKLEVYLGYARIEVEQIIKGKLDADYLPVACTDRRDLIDFGMSPSPHTVDESISKGFKLQYPVILLLKYGRDFLV